MKQSWFFYLVCLLCLGSVRVQAQPNSLAPGIGIRLLARLASEDPNNTDFPVRLAKDPVGPGLYLLNASGLVRYFVPGLAATVQLDTLYTSTDHGLLSGARGLAAGPDGSLYLVGNQDQGGATRFTIAKGTPGPNGHVWSVLARSDTYELCDCSFNHRANGLTVSPDGDSLYINSGSRTDHGEVRSNGGQYPDLRETELTALVLRVPTNASELRLPNDRGALRAAGYVYAEGLRNTFDMAFAPNGDLFGVENGPDRDMAEELNWLLPGRHYGFPWRLGDEANPNTLADYNPNTDPLLRPAYSSVADGLFFSDPDFPPPPGLFTEPVANRGPHADKYRDPRTGEVLDASDQGLSLGTFTAHRAPVGLVFDTELALAPPLQGAGFVLSWTPGYPASVGPRGPFFDASQDLLHLALEKVGDAYVVNATRLIADFIHPVDAELIGHRLYVIETSTEQRLWEITLPPVSATVVAASADEPEGFTLEQNYPNPFNSQTAIRFTLTTAATSVLAVYDLSGQRVATLVNGSLSAGTHAVEWDGRNAQGHAVASGVYVYRLHTGDKHLTRKLLLVR